MHQRRRVIVWMGFVTLWGMVSSTAAAQTAEPAPSADHFRVAIAGATSTIAVREQPLRRILSEISRQTGIGFFGLDILENTVVSVTLESHDTDAAIRHLLRDHDTFYAYAARAGSTPRLRTVWVYPQGAGQGLQPVPPAAWASTKELEQQLQDGTVEERVAALQGIIDRKKAGALDLIVKALHDTEEEIRVRALYHASARGISVPDSSLRLALDDSSARVRFLALQALERHADAREIASRASADVDAIVRQLAGEMLRRLDEQKRIDSTQPTVRKPQ